MIDKETPKNLISILKEMPRKDIYSLADRLIKHYNGKTLVNAEWLRKFAMGTYKEVGFSKIADLYNFFESSGFNDNNSKNIK